MDCLLLFVDWRLRFVVRGWLFVVCFVAMCSLLFVVCGLLFVA